jgi:hypothetical protein
MPIHQVPGTRRPRFTCQETKIHIPEFNFRM